MFVNQMDYWESLEEEGALLYDWMLKVNKVNVADRFDEHCAMNK